MIELKIWADVHSTGIFNSIGKFLLKEETTISDATWQELQAWVEKYDDIAIMEIDERLYHLDLIKDLDDQGINLMHKIAEEWHVELDSNEFIKFVYYSEGLLKEMEYFIPKYNPEEE